MRILINIYINSVKAQFVNKVIKDLRLFFGEDCIISNDGVYNKIPNLTQVAVVKVLHKSPANLEEVFRYLFYFTAHWNVSFSFDSNGQLDFFSANTKDKIRIKGIYQVFINLVDCDVGEGIEQMEVEMH